MYDNIIYDVEDPVALITLNRPEALNAWTPGMDKEIRDAISRAETDRTVVGIVISGSGRGFCAGADMKSLDRLSSEGGSGEAAASRQKFDDADGDFGGRFTYMLAASKPILAAVNGAVAGMGYPFSLCADIRVVSPDALFVTSFAHRGLIAEWGLSWLLPRLVGPSVALDLLFSSRRVYGEEALALGLANYITDADDLVPFCRRYIEDLAARGAPASFATMKRQVYEQLHNGLGEAELDSQKLMYATFGSDQFREGVRSFIEKRPPSFPRIGDS